MVSTFEKNNFESKSLLQGKKQKPGRSMQSSQRNSLQESYVIIKKENKPTFQTRGMDTQTTHNIVN